MMKQEKIYIREAEELMSDFAERTGLTSEKEQDRYLWTDAFAVCNFQGLARVAANKDFSAIALKLIEKVHNTLGRHRDDDPREGWISGLGDRKGKLNPTAGGLRIGKRLPERAAGEPLDRHIEWERDGQYFHYLTKWMHALDITARQICDTSYLAWACQLAHAAGNSFIYINKSGDLRMYWKMSVDLSRPQVESMGHHDPLDGYVTSEQIRATSGTFSEKRGDTTPGSCDNMDEQVHVYYGMLRGKSLETVDPLGIGGLLMDATRLAQLIAMDKSENEELLHEILTASAAGLASWDASDAMNNPPTRRLPFRELGLAIGLRGISWVSEELLPSLATGGGGRTGMQRVQRYFPLAEDIISLWLDPDNQTATTWTEHRNINSVMLATALEPSGFLLLPEVPSSDQTEQTGE